MQRSLGSSYLCIGEAAMVVAHSTPISISLDVIGERVALPCQFIYEKRHPHGRWTPQTVCIGVGVSPRDIQQLSPESAAS